MNCRPLLPTCYVTVSQVAGRLGVTTDKVLDMIHAGALPAHRPDLARADRRGRGVPARAGPGRRPLAGGARAAPGELCRSG